MDKVLKVGQQSLMGYLPAIMIKNILDGEIDPNKVLPAYHSMTTVSLFADISGFTKLSEVFAKKGRIGPEFLAFSLNRYMEQLRKNGGDIFKFAGDALLVVWPESKQNLQDTCRRAIQCAMDIQSKLNKVEMSPGKPLSVKIGIGVGDCRVLFVGGLFKRCEYLIVGEAMRQACMSECHATEGGQTIFSQSVYDLVSKFYEVEEAMPDDSHGDGGHDMKYFKIIKALGDRIAIKSDAYLMRTHFSAEKLREKLPILKTFVPNAISIYLDIEKENWSKEIRMITVMFLNLKVDLSQTKNEEGLQRIQDIVHVVQRCVYRTKGALNKFLMDDKGSVMLICWGIPPLSAPDDHIRSVLTALDLEKELKKFNCGAYMGIATGSCFTGVCGTIGGRREYSLLGEMVNLSARHMQKAIYHAKDMFVETKKKVDYVTLVCEKTRDLIQNKIACDYTCQGELKGFANNFFFYEPRSDLKPKIDSQSFFLPDIKTHRNNVLLGQPNPKEKTTLDSMLKTSLFMVGRKDYLDECQNTLLTVYKKAEREFILIRGVTGSGKSLFVRKMMYDFIESNKELKNKLNNKYAFIFVSSQNPVTLYNAMNGWSKILKEIYNHFKLSVNGKKKTNFKMGSETVTINCDPIGEILLNSDCLSYVRYIEEILETSFAGHYELPDDNTFSIFFQVKEIPKRDPFFESRKFDKYEKNICKFFLQLIKSYRETFIPEFPLFFILEDAHLIDEMSLELIKALTCKSVNPESHNKMAKGICVIVTYQDAMNSIVKNAFDRFGKYNELFLNEKTYMMDNITDFSLAHDLIRHSIQGRLNVNTISEKLMNIVLTKALKGNPLFIIEIMHSLIDSGYVKHPQQELLPTDELLETFELNDWSNFTIPIRMEKLLGHIIDNLSPKEIIILKHASVIGNLFDMDKLIELNPFSSITFDDLLVMLHNLEHFGIIEILFDINPKHMVCKFNIPFFREVLFQRMLIEQRSDIHLSIARKMQYSKFSYMPHKQEVTLLRNHLKITEMTILKHMEDKDDNNTGSNSNTNSNSNSKQLNNVANAGSSLNINNMKIILVKDICQRLKLIDLRMESEEIELSKRSLPIIKSGYLHKKSDKYISWEERYVVITNTKFFYWYHKEDYTNNKMPLGSFDLKSLYSVEILRDKIKGDKSNIFYMQVSNWFKKDKQSGARNYYFSCTNRDELYNWVITLNFLRVKAMYDEFSCNFGLINLPLSHEVNNKNKKSIKMKFNTNHRQIKNRNVQNNYNSIYNTIARKSYASNNKSAGESGNKSIFERNSVLLGGLSTNTNNQVERDIDDMDNSEKINKIKDLTMMCFNLGFTTMLGFIQDIIFGIDNVGLNDDRMITIPSHLNAFKYLSISNVNFQSPDKEINLGLKKDKSSVKQDQNYYSNIIDEDEEEDLRSQSSDALRHKNKAAGKNEKEGSNRNSTDNYTDKENQTISPKKGVIIPPKKSPEKISNNNNNKGENNISFQQNSNDPDSQFGKQFTLEEIGKSNKKDVTIINVNSNVNPYQDIKKNIKKNSFLNKFDNSINFKLKNLKIDNNDDKLEDLINTLSQGGNSKMSDDDDDDKNVSKPKENTKNMFNEINEKQNHNFNSRIFLKK